MEEKNYQSNSIRSKRESSVPETPVKKIEKVVTGEVKLKKKSIFNKFASIFIPEDVEGVKTYILLDIIVPSIKRGFLEAVEAFLYNGDVRGRVSSRASKFSYSSISDPRNTSRRDESPRLSLGFEYDDIILDSIMDAEQVLIRMDEIIEVYGMVSVGDLYDILGRTGPSTPYTYGNYGWRDLGGAKTVPVREGYLLKLPKAIPLK